MKNKKGFTLIELLAIIVILAIIAVITVPIILNIIDNSKKGAVVNSTYGYRDAIQKYYMNRSVSDASFEGPTGIYDISDLPSDFSVSGEVPNEGWVQLEKGKVVNYSLKFGDYVVSLDASTNMPLAVKNGEVSLMPGEAFAAEVIENLELVQKEDGAYYLPSTNTGVEVYYNPVSSTVECTEATSVSTPGTTTGCMHWYMYSIKGGYANMLLDHNITVAESELGEWASKDDYEAGLTLGTNDVPIGTQEGPDSKALTAGITYPGVTNFPRYNVSTSSPGVTSRGPVTALNTLKILTSEWKTERPKVPNSLSTNEYIIPSNANNDAFQIDYTGYHARLLTLEELVNLGCGYNLNQQCPIWLEKGTKREDSEVYNGVTGYWTSSINGTYKSYCLSSLSSSRIISSERPYSTALGVRPVITINIAEIADQLS